MARSAILQISQNTPEQVRGPAAKPKHSTGEKTMLSFVRNLVAAATQSRALLVLTLAMGIFMAVFTSTPVYATFDCTWEGMSAMCSNVCVYNATSCPDEAQLAAEAAAKFFKCVRGETGRENNRCWAYTVGTSDKEDFKGLGPNASNMANEMLAAARANAARKAVVTAGVPPLQAHILGWEHYDEEAGQRHQRCIVSTTELEPGAEVRAAEARGRVEALDLLNSMARDMSWATKAVAMLKVATSNTCTETTLVFTDQDVHPEMVRKCECPRQEGEYLDDGMPVDFWKQSESYRSWMTDLDTSVATAMADYTCTDAEKPVWDVTRSEKDRCRAFNQDELLNPQVVVENIRRLRTIILSDPKFQDRLIVLAGTTEGRVQWDGSLSGPSHEFRVYVDDQCDAINGVRQDQATALAETNARAEWERWNHFRLAPWAELTGSVGGTAPGMYSTVSSQFVGDMDIAGGLLLGTGNLALEIGGFGGVADDPTATDASGLFRFGGRVGFVARQAHRWNPGGHFEFGEGYAWLPGEKHLVETVDKDGNSEMVPVADSGWTQLQGRVVLEPLRFQNAQRNLAGSFGFWASFLFQPGIDYGYDGDQDTEGQSDWAAGLTFTLRYTGWENGWPQPRTEW